MNYYPHHIGDFNSATRHLTRVERSLYRDLIELYYDTEQPLPADDFDRLARRVIAVTDEEKDALRYVLSEFFTLDGDVYRHERCDEEIEKYHAQIAAKRKAGNASAKSRQAKKSAPKRTTSKQGGNENKQLLNTCSTDEQLTKNQEPRTNIYPLPPSQGAEAWKLPDWVPADLWSEFEAVRKKRKKPMTDRSRRLAVNRLEALQAEGHAVTAVMEQSILHAWDTFYPLKNETASTADRYGGLV